MSGTRTFSRWMRPVETKPLGVGGISCLALVTAVAIALVWAYPIGVPIVLLFFLAMAPLWARDRRRLRAMARARAGESICTFARAFPRRAVDPRVVRAVYEEVQRWCTIPGEPLPLRATDRFEEDLRVDGDTLEDIVSDIAERSRRSPDRPRKNPYYGKVKTVGDLVYFLSHQPRARAAA